MSMFGRKRSEDPETNEPRPVGDIVMEVLPPEAPNPTPPPNPGIMGSQEIERELFESMDEIMLALMRQLRGLTEFSREDRADIKMVSEWMQKSHRMRPKSNDDLPQGIEGMRQFIEDAVKKTLEPGTTGAKRERIRRAARQASRPDREVGSDLAKAMEKMA